MEKISKDIIDASITIQELSAFITSFITDKELVNRIQQKLKVEKTTDYGQAKIYLNNLYDVLELMCFIISERESSSTQIIESPYMKNIKISDHFNSLDVIANDLYRMMKKNPELQSKDEKEIFKTTKIDDVYNNFGIETDVFGHLNAEFLLATEEYFTKEQLPKGATIVALNIKNTQNLVTDITKIVDKVYVDKHFPLMNESTGVTDETLERYSVHKLYPDTEGIPTAPLDEKVVYQQMGDTYRKLIHYPEGDYVRNYDFIPANMMLTNFENKRIMMLRQNVPKNKLHSPIKDEAFGLIKYNYVSKHKSMADSAFMAMYNQNMTDEQVIKLGVSAFTLQGNLPKDNTASGRKMIEKDFLKYVNRKAIRNLI
jgi:hypothetical protein